MQRWPSSMHPTSFLYSYAMSMHLKSCNNSHIFWCSHWKDFFFCVTDSEEWSLLVKKPDNASWPYGIYLDCLVTWFYVPRNTTCHGAIVPQCHNSRSPDYQYYLEHSQFLKISLCQTYAIRETDHHIKQHNFIHHTFQVGRQSSFTDWEHISRRAKHLFTVRYAVGREWESALELVSR